MQRLMVGYATDVDLDGQGRILLSKALCAFAGLDKQTMLSGQGNKFELWNEERWNQNCDKWLSSNEPDDTDESTELKSLTL